MMNVLGVIPVGLVGERFGPELLADGKLWFLLDVDYDTGVGRRWLFDGVGVVGVVEWCWYSGSGVVSGTRECPVEELGVFRAAVERFIEDVGSGG